MNLNRPLTATADLSHVLRPGRVYRLACVVNGQTTVDALADRLVGLGFGQEDLCISTASEWADEAPGDWPDEPPIDVCANEELVRASGSFVGPAVEVERDTPIEEGAVFTIAAAWDYGRAAGRVERAGAAQGGEGDPPERNGLLVAGVALAAGLGLWKLTKKNREEDRDRKKLARMGAELERDQMIARTHALVSRGMSQAEAEETAHREAIARVEAFEAVERGEARGEDVERTERAEERASA
jgi:hypothetical protein